MTVQCSPLTAVPPSGKKDTLLLSLLHWGIPSLCPPVTPHHVCTPCWGFLDVSMKQPHLLSLDELKRGQQLACRLAAPSQREPGQPGHPFQTGLTHAASQKLICTLDRAWRKKSQHLPVQGSGWPQSNLQTYIQPPELERDSGVRAAPGTEWCTVPLLEGWENSMQVASGRHCWI